MRKRFAILLAAILTLFTIANNACGGPESPQVQFTATPTLGSTSKIIQFLDQSEGTDITSWSWDLGDGQTSTQKNPSHTYSKMGIYSVSLTVTDKNGSATQTKTGYIHIFNHIAVIETTMGPIKFGLYEDRAPITTANFIKLANSGFYNGLLFYGVIDELMIQGGDPTGTGSGGSPDTIPLEINEELTNIDGAVGMVRLPKDPNSATSKFYICDGPQGDLDGTYAVFGQVIEGMDVVRAITAVPTGANYKPLEDVKMTKVSIQSI